MTMINRIKEGGIAFVVYAVVFGLILPMFTGWTSINATIRNLVTTLVPIGVVLWIVFGDTLLSKK